MNFVFRLEYNMRSIFHVAIALCLAALAFTAPLRLANKDVHLSVASSREAENVQLMFTIKAKEGTEVQLFSEALSPSAGTHSLVLRGDSIEVNPPMSEQSLIWNSFHDNAYYLAFDHKFSGPLHFLPLEMTVEGQVTELMLPTFSHPMLMIPESSFYSCGKTLISVQTEEEGVHLSVFSDTHHQNWRLGGNWKLKWREIDGSITYGYAHRNQIREQISVIIEENLGCSFYVEELKASEEVLNPKKYYTMQEILKWAPKLRTSQLYSEEL